MQIVSTHIFMVMIFIGTSGQPSISSSSFLDMYPSIDPIDLEIEGLIVDVTTTKVGRDFYDMFYTNWNPSENLPQLPIVIEEKPFLGRASQVSVSVDDNIIFQRFIQPRYDIVEANAYEAIQAATIYLENYEALQKQLQGDDLAGSGIY